MLTEEKRILQLERLEATPWAEKAEAFDHLLLVISRLLHGRLEKDPKTGRKYLVGGYTKFGAHSDRELGGDALYHYQSLVVEKLYRGTCEWKPENTLAEQLEKLANRIIPKEAKKYEKRVEKEKKRGFNRNMLSLDVSWMTKPDDYTGEETEDLILTSNDYEEPEEEGQTTEIPTVEENKTIMAAEYEDGMDLMQRNWEKLCAAADDDPWLAEYVQTVGESKSLQEVRDKLELMPGEAELLKRKLKRRIN